jgi:hypothetical protein
MRTGETRVREILAALKPLGAEYPGSKSRVRGALGVGEFKRLARRVWPEVTREPLLSMSDLGRVHTIKTRS